MTKESDAEKKSDDWKSIIGGLIATTVTAYKADIVNAVQSKVAEKKRYALRSVMVYAIGGIAVVFALIAAAEEVAAQVGRASIGYGVLAGILLLIAGVLYYSNKKS